jgi:hypothetical protein
MKKSQRCKRYGGGGAFAWASKKVVRRQNKGEKYGASKCQHEKILSKPNLQVKRLPNSKDHSYLGKPLHTNSD